MNIERIRADTNSKKKIAQIANDKHMKSRTTAYFSLRPTFNKFFKLSKTVSLCPLIKIEAIVSPFITCLGVFAKSKEIELLKVKKMKKALLSKKLVGDSSL